MYLQANAATTEAAAIREKAKELMTAQQDAAKSIDVKRLQGKVGARQVRNAEHTAPPTSN